MESLLEEQRVVLLSTFNQPLHGGDDVRLGWEVGGVRPLLIGEKLDIGVLVAKLLCAMSAAPSKVRGAREWTHG